MLVDTRQLKKMEETGKLNTKTEKDIIINKKKKKKPSIFFKRYLLNFFDLRTLNSL